MSELQRQINHAKTLQESFSALSDSLGNMVAATDEEYTAFESHLQDKIDELLTPIEESSEE